MSIFGIQSGVRPMTELMLSTDASSRHSITASNAATLSGKLSQLANGAIYSDDGDVNIFHERTVDERILKALEAKDLTQSALIDAVKAEVGDGK